MSEMTPTQLEIFKAMSALAVAWVSIRPEMSDGAYYAQKSVDAMIEHIKKNYPAEVAKPASINPLSGPPKMASGY